MLSGNISAWKKTVDKFNFSKKRTQGMKALMAQIKDHQRVTGYKVMIVCYIKLDLFINIVTRFKFSFWTHGLVEMPTPGQALIGAELQMMQ